MQRKIWVVILSGVLIIFGIFVSVRKLRATDFQTIAESGNIKIKIGNFVANDECQMSNDNENNNNLNTNSENSNSNLNDECRTSDDNNSNSNDNTNTNENGNTNNNTNSNDNINENENINTNTNSETEVIFPDFTINLPERVKAGEEFEVSVSSESGLDGFNYFWDKDENDYESSNGKEPIDLNFEYEGREVTLQYLKPGNYTIVLEVRDDRGNSSRQRAEIDVSNPDLTGQIRTSAVLPNPVGVDNALRPNGEVVWLLNQSEFFVDVSGWILYDTDDTHELFITSENISGEVGLMIPPGGEMKVFRNGDSDFSLNNEGDTVRLYSGPIEMMGEKQDEIVYPAAKEGKIYVKNFETGFFEETDAEATPVISRLFSNVVFFAIPTAQAAETSAVKSENFEGFSLEKELLPGEKMERGFSLENGGEALKEVYLKSSLSSDITLNEKENVLKNLFVEIKEGENCVFGCENKKSLFDLGEDPKIILEMAPLDRKELILNISLGSEIPTEEIGEEVYFSLVLMQETDNDNDNGESIMENGNTNDNGEGTMDNGNTNSNLNDECQMSNDEPTTPETDCPEMDGSGNGMGQAQNENGNKSIPEGVSDEEVVKNIENNKTWNMEHETETISLTKPDNLEKKSDKKKEKSKKKEEEQDETWSRKHETDDKSQETAVSQRGTARNKLLRSFDGARQTNSNNQISNNNQSAPAPFAMGQEGEENINNNLGSVDKPESSEGDKILLSAKKQDPVKSFWSFFTGMSFLTKMFFLWMVVWGGLFGFFWKRIR